MNEHHAMEPTRPLLAFFSLSGCALPSAARGSGSEARARHHFLTRKLSWRSLVLPPVCLAESIAIHASSRLSMIVQTVL